MCNMRTQVQPWAKNKLSFEEHAFNCTAPKLLTTGTHHNLYISYLINNNILYQMKTETSSKPHQHTRNSHDHLRCYCVHQQKSEELNKKKKNKVRSNGRKII